MQETLFLHLSVGFGIFYGVTKFFDSVADRISEDTRVEISVWLLDARAAAHVQGWPAAFFQVFKKVFGDRPLSWRCFSRSFLISGTVYLCCLPLQLLMSPLAIRTHDVEPTLLAALVFGAIPDYFSLLITFCVLFSMTRSAVKLAPLWLLVDLYLTVIILSFAAVIGIPAVASLKNENGIWDLLVAIFAGAVKVLTQDVQDHPLQGVWEILSLRVFWVIIHDSLIQGLTYPYFLSAAITSIWLWLYAGSVFLLRAARLADVGFKWFNRRFDIENKPLQCIGLVGASIAATSYWIWQLVHGTFLS